jgi:integrase
MKEPSPRQLAELVAAYVAYIEEIYQSRAWKTVRSALARLVNSAHALDYENLRDAARNLAKNDELSKSYRRDCINTWKRFLAWCVENEEVEANLLQRFQCVRLRYPLNREECRIPPSELKTDPRRNPDAFVIDLMRALPKMSRQLRDIVLLLALTGARPGEILALTTDAIETDLTPWVAELNRHKTSHHTDRPRYIVFSPRAQVILDKYRTPFAPTDFLFPRPKSRLEHITTDLVQRRLRRCLLKHKLPYFTLYDLRRWAATTTRRSGDLQAAQALLGHSRASTTEIYAPPDLSRAITAALNLGEALQ